MILFNLVHNFFFLLESAVVNSDDRANTKESNFTVIVKNGVGIQVAEENDMLSLIVMVPPHVRNWSNFTLLGMN